MSLPTRSGSTAVATAAPSERDVLAAVRVALANALPDRWQLGFVDVPDRLGPELDAILKLEPPDEKAIYVALQVKANPSPVDAPTLIKRMRQSVDASPLPAPTAVMLVSRYLSATVRGSIAEVGGSYADATGNLRLSIDEPLVFIRDRGESADPWRGRGRPRGTLKGAPAARVVRALIDFSPPYSRPELVKLSRTSTGVAYRVVEFLESERILERERALITAVDWPQLLTRWSADYGFGTSNPVELYLEPRGLPALLDQLRELGTDGDYVLTGSLAAAAFAPYAPPRLATLYVRDWWRVPEQMGLRRVESGGNVLVARTKYDAVFDRPITLDGVSMAAPSQAAVDLMTGPGRQPSEAEELIEWMKRNESRWRV